MNVPVRRALLLGAVALLLVSSLGSVGASAPAPAAGSSAPPVTGNLTGPAYLGMQTNGTYWINATGGPAVVDGRLLGQLTWTAKVSGPDVSGVSVLPLNGSITALGKPSTVTLRVSNVSEAVTLVVEVLSTLAGSNASTNLTYTVQVEVPYVVRAVVVAGATAVLPFTVVVDLDGARVGNVTVPALVAHQGYQIVFRYADPHLASGTHTFTLSVANEHGLVTFSDGRTSFSTSFYVAGPTPNYAIWYVAGAVAFFLALFIFATRVAARRRTPGKR